MGHSPLRHLGERLAVPVLRFVRLRSRCQDEVGRGQVLENHDLLPVLGEKQAPH